MSRYKSDLLDGFRHNLFEQEGFLTVDTLRLALIGDDQHAFAFGAGQGEWFLPRSEITIGIIDTAEEGAPLAGLAFDQLAAIGWTVHANLQQPGFGITAIGEAAA